MYYSTHALAPYRWVWLLACLLPFVSFAQLRVTNPVPRMVFQRSIYNEATIIVTGLASPAATLVEARFVPLAINQGSVTAWKQLSLSPGSSVFRGQVTVSAGWYRLDVRAKAGTTLLSETKVNRVGVGEVFVVAGQSNAYGGLERIPNTTDDRVSCVDSRQDNLIEQLLPVQFSHTSYGTNIGPSQPPHIWGPLGDKLTQRLNVPVLFLGAALGGSDSFEWQRSAAGTIGTTPGSSVYRRLGVALLHYIRRTGARAVLWHQGESDRLYNTSTQDYFNNIRFVIEKSRQQLGQAPLPWVMSRASYIDGQGSANVITAQNRLINEVPSVFPGPETDNIIGPENRPDATHLIGAGFFRFIDSWDQSLTNAFFENAVPYTPSDESALITSGYTLPLTRRPGETLAAASVRNDAHEADNLYIVQVLRTDNGATVYESPATNDNPVLVTLPANLPDGSYQLRTLSNHPVITGALGEPFTIRQSAPATPAPQNPIRVSVTGGAPDAALLKVGYRYESDSHGFFFMVRANAPMDVRLEPIDGGAFNDTGWHPAPPSSQSPDYDQFADFNYLRSYPPPTAFLDGVRPGRYRLSVRRQGDTGAGVWFEATLLDGRVILFYPMEPVGAIPPVVTITNPAPPTCVNPSFSVAVEVTDGTLNGGNTLSVRLSNADGSFAGETIIGSGSASPVQATLPANLPPGNNYRIRVVASNPAVASAPSDPLSFCTGAADLSLTLRVSNRTPAVDQPITVTLVVASAGPQSTNNVTAGSLLPDGLIFVDSASPAVSASSGSVIVNAGTLNGGESRSVAFRLKATRPGSFATAAQVTGSTTADPDSQVNSGTGDGQDDAAFADVRTADGTGTLMVSPNPNQTPLPPVQSNQPATNSATADLSLSLTASRLAVGQDEVIQLTVRVSNRGGAVANNVSIQTLLPTGWQLTDTNGLVVNGQTITGTLASVTAGGSATLTLMVRVNGSGTVQAQVSTVIPADPDSTPGNGYGNGEDDEAAVRVRLR